MRKRIGFKYVRGNKRCKVTSLTINDKFNRFYSSVVARRIVPQLTRNFMRTYLLHVFYTESTLDHIIHEHARTGVHRITR